MTAPPKDVRLPLMVTPADLKAIDDWRFERRIGSRAAAMRALLRRGLAFDAVVRAATDFLATTEVKEGEPSLRVQIAVVRAMVQSLDNVEEIELPDGTVVANPLDVLRRLVEEIAPDDRS